MTVELVDFHVVCDRTHVSVSGTETKVQFWYQYWSQNFSFRNFFFHKRFLKNQIFVMFSHFLGNTDFYKLQKKIKKFGFMSPLKMENIGNLNFTLKIGLGISYGIGLKVLGNLCFGIGPKPK